MTSIKIPMPLAKRIDAHIARDGVFTNRSHWIRYQVMRILDEEKQ